MWNISLPLPWNRCCSVATSCPTFHDPMDCSMPSFPGPHHHLEFAKVQVHCISDAIQPSHPLLPSSLPAFNLSQHQGLFQWVTSLRQMTKILELQLQHQSFQWVFRVDFLYDWLVWSLCCPRDSQESSPGPQLESINSLALCLLYAPALTIGHDYWKDHSLDYMDFGSKVMSLLFTTWSMFVIAFLLRSNHLLISWLQLIMQRIISYYRHKWMRDFAFFLMRRLKMLFVNL